MKYIAIFIFAGTNLFAQGFNWQNNARLPMTFPDWYLGIHLEGGISDHHGDIEFIEANTLCCPYNGGTGAKILFGASAEKWLESDLAVNLDLSFAYEIIEFSAQDRIPVEPGKYWNTEFRSNIAFASIDLGAGLKYRILESKFNLGFGINAALMISDDQEHKEISLSPEYPFIDGSYEFIITDGQLPEISIFQILPNISLSYDIDMGYPNYATIQAGFTYPITRIAENWNREYLSLSFIYYFGMF